jgi:citrate synthase
MILKEKLSEKILEWKKEIINLVVKHSKDVIGEVTLEQVFGGMRGIKGLFCDTSEVGLDTGLSIRGIPILDLVDKLPEEVFYLMLTGELPSKEALEDLQGELVKRNKVPPYVWDVINALPAETHPMVMLDTAILVMENESIFRKKYDEGIEKEKIWDPVFEDSLNLIAVLPDIASYIYRKRFNKGPRIEPDTSLDWAANYAHMLGIEKYPECFKKAMRFYMTLHADHEGGNVSAFSCATIASAFSDPYYAVSGGLNGLAGPLHGLANQECLRFIIKLSEHFGHMPSNAEVKQYCEELLDHGRVIAGYGHAVLRVTDPRFTAVMNFQCEGLPDDPLVTIVKQLFEEVPKILLARGKAKDPWPNLDAASGALLHRFGFTEQDYYTVLFSVSRTLGLTAQMILARGIGLPIIRPKSLTLKSIKKIVEK